MKTFEGTIVSQKPGNPKLKYFFKADSVIGVGEAHPEFAVTGAATMVDTHEGTLYVTEDIEEMRKRWEEALKDS